MTKSVYNSDHQSNRSFMLPMQIAIYSVLQSFSLQQTAWNYISIMHEKMCVHSYCRNKVDAGRHSWTAAYSWAGSCRRYLNGCLAVHDLQRTGDVLTWVTNCLRNWC